MLSFRKSLFLIITTIYFYLKVTLSKEAVIFETQNEISFAEIKDFTIDLKDKIKLIENENESYRSFLSVYVNVTLSEDCVKNSKVNSFK